MPFPLTRSARPQWTITDNPPYICCHRVKGAVSRRWWALQRWQGRSWIDDAIAFSLGVAFTVALLNIHSLKVQLWPYVCPAGQPTYWRANPQTKRREPFKRFEGGQVLKVNVGPVN